MNGETVENSQVTVYPESESQITSYQLVSYEAIDDEGFLYLVDLQLETVEIYELNVTQTSNDNIPFDIDDFALTITPSTEIDSAGGVYYSYNIENNSPIPVTRMRLNVKFEV